jgi:hypothetical protein
MIKYSYLFFLIFVLTLTGCASGTKNIYQWESYQPKTLEYLKATGEGPEKQIIELEAGLEKIKSNNGTPPPGYHAFLGFLYEKSGKHDLMIKELQEEKALFPESSVYMDLMIRKYAK